MSELLYLLNDTGTIISVDLQQVGQIKALLAILKDVAICDIGRDGLTP